MNDNIVSLVQGGKNDDEEFPNNDYVVVDIDGEEFYSSGFLIFTSQHLAVMTPSDSDKGPIPSLVMPLNRLKYAELIEPEQEELPF